MRVINYKYGYYNIFNCTIHGKIRVTKEEWDKIQKYLFNPAVKSYYLYKNILKQDMLRTIKTKKAILCNIRVTATELIVKHFKLKNYKRGNYMFEII